MRRSRRSIVIASRRSPLARAQALLVGQALSRLHPNVGIEYLHVETDGDRISQGSLADLGGKGLFTRTVESVVKEGGADIAVHSLKDMPAADTIGHKNRGLIIAAVPRRADFRDCLISAHATSIDQLPPTATVGTASPRRAAQLKKLRPDLKIQSLRGNVDTRIRKTLEPGGVGATLLAKAGLERLGLREHAQHPIHPDLILPSAGQGALAIQCRLDNHATLIRCLPLNHAVSAVAVNAEQQVVAGLAGDCNSPIAVLAEPSTKNGTQEFRLRARVLGPNGETCAESDRRGHSKMLSDLVKQVLEDLLAAGAAQILGQSAPTP